jgi:LuxR family maltose regulon positive regulatory protein
MDSSLLATQARVPPQTHRVLPRARLVAALERGIPDHRLVLVSAPAGYGKTTLLTQWARESRFAIAWLTLGEEDNDPDRFFRSLLVAWAAVRPAVTESPLGLLLGATAPDRDAVLSAFVTLAAGNPDQTVSVLDDYHLIEDAAIHDALTFLLDHLPPSVHLVLAGRADPPLPLARYRAHRDLLELRGDALAFSADETAEFFDRLGGLALTEEQIGSLHAQLEGWAAGLHLVSLTLRRRPDAADRLAVGGRHRFVADYLSEDVLAHLPDAMRRFLLRTSILDRLCGPLCDAVTGGDDGQATLELLERENLFLLPLDDDREWFRYHRLFADYLREDLRRRHPDEVADLHRRAAAWHFARDLPEPAFRHAVAAADLDLTVQIVERYTNAKLMACEFRVIQEWVDALPEGWYAAYPALGLMRAGLLAFSGAFDACVRCLDDIDQRLALAEGDAARRQRALLVTVRCFIACMQNDLERAERLADRALQDLPDEDLGYRPGIFAALGDTYRRVARWQDARACYLRALDFPQTPAVRIGSVHVFGALADLELRQGRLRRAADYWRKALASIQEPQNWGRIELPVIGWVYLRLGELLYEWNDLDGARDHLARGLARSELGGDVRALIAGYVIAARLHLTEGDVAATAASLERAQPLVEQAPFPDWTGRFARCRVDLWLAQDQLRAAIDWVDAMLRDGAIEERPDGESAALAVARVLVAKRDASARERALALLDRLHRAAESEGKTGVEIEALALRALARWQTGDRAGALTTLEHGLRLAEPEGYVRLFADLGLPMARLLQEAHSRRVMPDYVSALLAACGADLASPTAAERALPEPLSGRELEVLRMIAAGLTNREIADALSISPETIKKHTAAIYGKLGASNRTEAAAKARELAILG